MFGAIAGLASAGLGWLGAKKSASSQNAANAANMALAREQLDYQKQLNRNQIQWRVEDARKAGLHPLAALGVSPASYSPVSASAVGANYDYSSIGNGLQAMGQNIDTAILAGKTREERKEAMALQSKQIGLALRNQELNNQILEQELISRRMQMFQQVVPPSPSSRGLSTQKYAIPAGQVDSRMSPGPMAYMDKPIVESGALKDSRGRIIDIVPANDWKQRTEDTLIVEWAPWLRQLTQGLRAKFLGKQNNGYWWYGDQYLPMPPSKDKAWNRVYKRNPKIGHYGRLR